MNKLYKMTKKYDEKENHFSAKSYAKKSLYKRELLLKRVSHESY